MNGIIKVQITYDCDFYDGNKDVGSWGLSMKKKLKDNLLIQLNTIENTCNAVIYGCSCMKTACVKNNKID